MKLRKIFATAAMSLLVGVSAMAQTPQEIRIYINPGHGSWSANCRPMGTVKHGANNAYTDVNNDTTNFFESNTNLYKCFGVLEKLIEYGVPFDRTKNQTNDNPHRVGAALDLTQNIVFSRVKSGGYPAYSDYTNNVENSDNAYYDRGLSVIAGEVKANNFDMMISVHSNAASGIETNYLYYALDGYSDASSEKITLSKEMARLGWNHSILDRHQQWTHYDYTMTAADLASGKGKIGQQNLGVLNHTVPGYLVEGYFHTYQPSRHRAMNWDVDRMEGVTYARGIADYFGWTKESTGDIYGVVRDLHEKFSHEFYNGRAGTPDIYLPLNNVTVTLKKAGAEVATYTTDDEYNGAFVFAGLEPGDYTVEFTHPDYKAIDPVAVTVEAAKTAYPTAYLENVNYVPPTMVHRNYPDSLAGKDYALGDAYNVDLAEINLLAEQLTGKTIRRQIVRDNKLYVLALDETNAPSVYVANLVDNTVVELGTTICQTDADFAEGLKLADITLTADGYLLGGNYSKNTYAAGGGTYRAYKWENDDNGVPTGEAVELFTSQTAAMYATGRIGLTIGYSGTLEDGYYIATVMHNAGNHNKHFRFAGFVVLDGQKAGEASMNNYAAESPWNCVAFGEKQSLTPSPFYDELDPANNNEQFVIDGDVALPTEFVTDGAQLVDNTILKTMTEGAAVALNGSFFKYNGKVVFVSPAVNEEGKVTGIAAYDVTEGLDKATAIKVNGATIEPAEYTFASAHGELALEIDDSDRDNPKTVGAEIELFLVVDGKVYKYSTAGVEQPATANAFAYGLSVVLPDDGSNDSNLVFNLTGASSKVDVVLTPVAGGEDVVYSLGALGEGEHSYTIDQSTLTGEYKWSVSVVNKVNNGTDILFSDNAWGASSDALLNGGVAVDNDPESDYFGNVYVSADTKGIYVYGADGVSKSETGYWTEHGGNLHRGAVSNGKFYVADNSTAKSGIWMFDPANPTVENQVASGNQPCAVSFFGEGEERDMYAAGAYSGATGSQLLKYDNIGTADTWSGSPAWVQAADARMYGSNHFSVITVESGHLISQYREGSSNYAPGFFFVDNGGTIHHYATDLASVLPGCKKSGMALSKDGSLFAIVALNGQIPIFDVVWNDGIPAFTHKVTIQSNDGVIWGLAFDYANNLHCYNESAGYCVHAVPCDANVVVTPAKMTVNGNAPSAIEEVGADVNAPVEYYNLQGVKVANPSNGIFIKKQGNKATKVVL